MDFIIYVVRPSRFLRASLAVVAITTGPLFRCSEI